MQDMAKQPSYRPLQHSPFFDNGMASRTPVTGTVARGQLNEDTAFYTGKTDKNEWTQAAGLVAAVGQAPTAGLLVAATSDPYEDAFPWPVTRDVLERGRLRFDVFCSVCHDRTGGGKGMIERRGFTKPPSLHEPRLRQARPGYFVHVMTRGFGAMPDYAAQIPPAERWEIAAYVRALQLSQHATLDDVPGKTKEEKVRTVEKGGPTR